MKHFGIAKNQETGQVKIYRLKSLVNPLNPTNIYEGTFEFDDAELDILIGFLKNDERYKHLF